MSKDVPIDQEIARVKAQIEQRRLQLKEVNLKMTSIRSEYQQHHVHGGGKIGGAIRGFQQMGKDSKLGKQQPVKEKLQREKLILEKQLAQLKENKAQGVQIVQLPRGWL